MKKSNLFKLFFTAVSVFAMTAFVSCVKDNDDIGTPYIKVEPSEIVFNLDGTVSEGSTDIINIETNRPWRAKVEEGKDWVRLSALDGEGNSEVTVTVPASNVGDEAKVTFEIFNSYGVLESETIKVIHGSKVPSVTIYHETMGTEATASPYPLVGTYTSWDTTGEGAANVSYEGVNTSVRSNGSNIGGYDGASGPNNVFFGAAPATFTVKNISLAAGQTNLKLTFGGQSFVYDTKDNNFDVNKFVVSLSADGTTWVPITYTKNSGDQTTPNWVFATADFTLAKAVSTLYIKFEAKESSIFRTDDITLETGRGGQTVNLEGGDEPPPPVGDAIYYETMGTEAVAKPYPFVNDYTSWNKTGDGAANVSYEGVNATVRSNGSNIGGYDGASGPNNVFFGAAPATFTVKNIALTSADTKLQLTFGGQSFVYDTKDNNFDINNFIVSLSADGTTWVPITYTKNDGDKAAPNWIVATADFTLAKSVSSLYIKFEAKTASIYRLDDITLKAGNGGQTVNLEGGDEPPPPPVVDAIYYETMGTEAVAKPYPFVNDYTSWNKTGDGAANVSYEGANASVRSNASNAGAYEGASGPNNVFFGTVPATFTIKNIALTSADTKLQLTFGGQSFVYDTKDNNFDINNFIVSLSADGTKWVPITYTKNNGDQTAPNWIVATADFTLAKAVSSLYIMFEAKTASIYRLDDIMLKAGNGGQAVDLDGGGVVPPTDPTITGVNPTSLSFPAEGATKTIAVSVANKGANTLSVSGLSGLLSASVDNSTNVVSVVAQANAGVAVNQTLTISLSGGNSVTVPVSLAAPSSGNETTVTFTHATISAANPDLTTNGYGTQAIDNPDTWIKWTADGIDFSGVKICNAATTYAGYLQIQGNATDAVKQGFIGNTSDLGRIVKIVVTTVNNKYEPSYSMYVGAEQMPTGNKQERTFTTTDGPGTLKTYVETYDLSGGSYGYFNLKNDTVGATYLESVVITYEK